MTPEYMNMCSDYSAIEEAGNIKCYLLFWVKKFAIGDEEPGKEMISLVVPFPDKYISRRYTKNVCTYFQLFLKLEMSITSPKSPAIVDVEERLAGMKQEER
jgi:hypothetical protein